MKEDKMITNRLFSRVLFVKHKPFESSYVALIFFTKQATVMDICTHNHYYMSFALALAERGRFGVSPNPMVGCVIVKNNKIVGQGYHQRYGEPHAEIFALKEAGDHAKDATAYVTLEPCCHFGKTPPCTMALIRAGIKKVVIACEDPNPLVSGKGIATLENAGILVDKGILELNAKKLNEIFFYYIKNKRPFVIAKWAMSLDGKTITHPDDSRQISGVASQKKTHQLRQQVDAILVGANTVRIDNPLLTARFGQPIKQPIRIVLCGKNSIPSDLKLFESSSDGKIILVTTKSHRKIFVALQSKNIELMLVDENKNQLPCVTQLLDNLGKRGISSLLIEGGMTIFSEFFAQNCVNKIDVYLSPTIVGNSDRKKRITINSVSKLGEDLCVSGENNV